MSRFVWPSAASVTTRFSLGGERADTALRGRARPRARRVELGTTSVGEARGAAGVGELERLAERVPRVGRLPTGAAPSRAPAAPSRARAAAARREQLDRLAQVGRARPPRSSVPSTRSVRPRSAGAPQRARELDLLLASASACSPRPEPVVRLAALCERHGAPRADATLTTWERSRATCSAVASASSRLALGELEREAADEPVASAVGGEVGGPPPLSSSLACLGSRRVASRAAPGTSRTYTIPCERAVAPARARPDVPQLPRASASSPRRATSEGRTRG